MKKVLALFLGLSAFSTAHAGEIINWNGQQVYRTSTFGCAELQSIVAQNRAIQVLGTFSGLIWTVYADRRDIGPLDANLQFVESARFRTLDAGRCHIGYNVNNYPTPNDNGGA
jgi:hypothetical protein